MQRRIIALTACFGLVLMFTSAALAQYKLTNLSSNQVGKASHADPLLANAWGIVHAPGSPWWVSDNTSGWATLYDQQGNLIQQLKVLIPTAGENGPGTPTGIVFNGGNGFQVQGWPSIFLFATLDGTISGWAPQSNFNQAIVAVNHASKKSVYTGLAINATGTAIYAANLAHSRVEMYDQNFTLLKVFTDPKLPTGFAPFGIQDINGTLYVTFASASGGSGGFVEQFREDGTPMSPGKPLIHGAPLNQPWGVALAPANFGPLSGALLVSNNTNSGEINGFNPVTGAFMGTVKDANGKPIEIDQLWGIGFGDGLGANGAPNQLFFSAGPRNNFAGTFGVIQ